MTDKLLERNPEAESHPSGERVVIFHKASKNSIVLNPTGSWIWDQLTEPRSESWLLDQMVEVFPDVERGQLEKDLGVYLTELKANQLLA